MDLQSLLKRIKLNENNISMILGALILIVIGVIVVNYFKSLEPTDTLPTGVATENADQVKLPATHTVEAGETLWSIAEKYYKSGYNWVDIQKANNLTNASVIAKGQQLTIPEVAAKTATVKADEQVAIATPEATKAPEIAETTKPEEESSISATTKGGLPVSGTMTTSKGTTITGESYTVVHGDSLWTIAERAYGDGHEWLKISKANKLVHPGTIHAGNVLTLPR